MQQTIIIFLTSAITMIKNNNIKTVINIVENSIKFFTIVIYYAWASTNRVLWQCIWQKKTQSNDDVDQKGELHEHNFFFWSRHTPVYIFLYLFRCVRPAARPPKERKRHKKSPSFLNLWHVDVQAAAEKRNIIWEKVRLFESLAWIKNVWQ